MLDINRRLDRLEERLFEIERHLGIGRQPPVHAEPPEAAQPPSEPPQDTVEVQPSPPSPPEPRQPPRPPTKPRHTRPATSNLMAWAAAGSFLLAGAYFIVLAYEYGWLTPTLQIVFASGAGIALIAGGVWFAGRDRDYAAYMPAVGLAILYFAVYAGHLYYALIPFPIAVVAIAATSLTGMALGRRFGNSAFTVLSALGVYLTPILIPASYADLIGIVIYFSVWSLLFSFLALQEQRRATYLVALYLALVCFDAAWRIAGSESWALAAGYQLTQFLIFASTAAAFSIIHRQPMDDFDAWWHGVPLFYFYGLEFLLIKEHAPHIVAPAALFSVVVVIGLFLTARRRLADGGSLAASAVLVSSYCSFVTGHILFFEILPDDYFAWGALLVTVSVAIAVQRLDWDPRIAMPIIVVSGLLFVWGFALALVPDNGVYPVPMPNAALLLYGVALYAAYYLVKGQQAVRQFAAIALYMGHLALMVTTVRFFASGLLISLVWAVFAVALLLLALRLKDRDLGQSSLIIFTASGFKVLLYDLAESAPLIRIVTLIVLGGSLYIGGWLYQNLVRRTKTFHPDAEINEQIQIIRDLVDQGHDDAGVVRFLIEAQIACRKDGGWDTALVRQIRADHGLG